MESKKPRYPPIQRILDLRKRLWEKMMLEYHCLTAAGDDFVRMANTLYAMLPACVNRQAFDRTMETLAGCLIDDKVIYDLSWRLAGNLVHLRNGRAVPPWTRQPFPEWVPAQVTEVRKAQIHVRGDTPEGMFKPGAWFEYMIVGGLAAGHKICKPQTWNYCRHIRAAFGFSEWDRQRYSCNVSSQPNYPLRDLNEFYRLRIFLLIDPQCCRGRPDFTELDGSQTFINYNRSLFRRRLREGFDCPKNYPLSEVPCYSCEVGLDLCQAACHANSYLPGECSGCKKPGWFDPASKSGVCVDCNARKN